MATSKTFFVLFIFVIIINANNCWKLENTWIEKFRRSFVPTSPSPFINRYSYTQPYGENSKDILCPPGYHKNNRGDMQCSDIDECLIITCGENQKCLNTEGSYTCHCEAGYFMSPNKGTCEKIEDLPPQAIITGITKNPEVNTENIICAQQMYGQRVCDYVYNKCPPGFVKNAKSQLCEKETKAKICNSPPNAHQEICGCPEGYEKDLYSNLCYPTPTVDVCRTGENACSKLEICRMTDTSYTCDCAQGYFRDPDTNKCRLEITNPCEPNRCHRVSEVCRATSNGFTCDCAEGFIWDPNYKNCQKKLPQIDYCNSKYNTCDKKTEKCRRTLSFFTCDCSDGYFRNKKTNICEPEGSSEIDECATNKHDCDPETERCINLEKSYTCDCKPGYHPNPFTKKCEKDITEVDECFEGTDNCDDETEDCQDTKTSYTCNCKFGYVRNPNTKECEAESIDECSENTHKCDLEKEVCKKLTSSYTCECKTDYIRHPTTKECEKPTKYVDYCTLGTHECDQATENCRLVAKFYTCDCKDNFFRSPDDGKCKPDVIVDECKENTHNCPSDEKCVKLEKSYTCECFKGFERNTVNRKCEKIVIPIDECASGSHKCDSETELCVKNLFSYSCKCKNGYLYSPKTQKCEIETTLPPPVTFKCEKITQKCNTNGRCVQTRDGNECKCQIGYRQIGRVCQPIIERTPKQITISPATTVPTPQETTCENTICEQTCSFGYSYDYESNLCKRPRTRTGLCEVPCGSGSICYGRSYINKCVCQTGYRKTHSRCTPVYTSESTDSGQNESNSGEDLESFCSSGFEMDENNQCVDIDECMMDPTVCKSNEKCINKIGTYSCECMPGFQQQGDTCIDVDECLTMSCGRNAICINHVGSYECSCFYGYKKNRNGLCEKKLRSLCPKGFNYNEDKRQCIDIDECQSEKKCDHGCVNTEGSYYCSCRDGWSLRADNISCEDNDECDETTCNENEVCINLHGRAECVKMECPSGYSVREQIEDDSISCELTNCENKNCINKASIVSKYFLELECDFLKIGHPIVSKSYENTSCESLSLESIHTKSGAKMTKLTVEDFHFVCKNGEVNIYVKKTPDLEIFLLKVKIMKERSFEIDEFQCFITE